jgi:hypothetical protein
MRSGQGPDRAVLETAGLGGVLTATPSISGGRGQHM